jgi:hypothetical protein
MMTIDARPSPRLQSGTAAVLRFSDVNARTSKSGTVK